MALDRAIGALCIGVVAAVTSAALVASASGPPSPPRSGPPVEETTGPIDDPETTTAFLEYYDRAERTAWALDASWERREGDDVRLETGWHAVQDGAGNKLTEAFGNLRGVYGGRSITCGLIEEERVVCDAQVAPEPEVRFAQSAGIARELTTPGSGTYTVARAPGRTVAGQQTDCFVLRRRAGHAGWAFGAETTFCYSERAAPLLVVRREGAVVDTRRATAVSFEVDDLHFQALLAPRADVLAELDLRSPA